MVMVYYFKACARCNGDLVEDGDERRCVQCGRVLYSHNIETEEPVRKAHSTPNKDIGKYDQSWINLYRGTITMFQDGMTNQEIAKELGIHEDTVRHRKDRYTEILKYRTIDK